MSLSNRNCKPCHGGTPKLTSAEIESYSQELKGWTVDQEKKLIKSYKTKDFMRALEKANAIGEIAEDQGHHPDLLVRWGELRVEIWTHAIGGLSESDFILAAKIDQQLSQ